MKTSGKITLMLAITACINHSANAQNGRTTTTTTVTSGSSGAGTATVRPSTTMDGRFVGKLIALNAYEIRLLQLATGMSRRQDLKEHAQHMLEDHQKLDAQVRAYATSHDYTSMEKKDAKYDEKIAKRSNGPAGLEWDKDIIEDLVDAHEDGIEIMRKERKNLSDQQLVAIVDAALPKMEEHLAILKPLESGAKEAVWTNDTAAGNGMHMNTGMDHSGMKNSGRRGGVNNNNTILNSDYTGNNNNSSQNNDNTNGSNNSNNKDTGTNSNGSMNSNGTNNNTNNNNNSR